MSRGRAVVFSAFGLGRVVIVLRFSVLLGYPYPILQLNRGGFCGTRFCLILVCAHRHFQVAVLFSSRSGICEAKSKPREIATKLFF